VRKIRGKTTSRMVTVKDGLKLEMKIIIPNLFDGRERRGELWRGRCLTSQAGEGGNGRRGEHGHSEERVVRKSRLGPNSLSQQMHKAGPRTPSQPQPLHVTSNFSLFQKHFSHPQFPSSAQEIILQFCKEFRSKKIG